MSLARRLDRFTEGVAMNGHAVSEPRVVFAVGCRVRRGLAGWRAGLICAFIAVGSLSGVAAASTATPPVISIKVDDAVLAPLGAPAVFTWAAAIGRPLEVLASITRGDISPVDVYLGVLVPDGRLLSWVPGSSTTPVLVAGLAPAGRGVTASSVSSAMLLGSNPQYLFSAADALGLYSLLVILVPAGAAPSDPRNWTAATMSPLVISN
jgi:hypothetical protein